MQLIDIGVNLAHDSFDADRDAVLGRAAAAGVTQMIVTGASVAGTSAALELARAHPARLYATSGVHPHQASTWNAETEKEIRALAQHPEVVAVGECGLDYFRDFSPREAQRHAFQRQLELAAELHQPVFLHERDAHEDFLNMLRECRRALVGGVVHCFTGDLAQMNQYLQLDLYIGITGWICDERRGAHLKEIVREIPADRLLLETDAPYLLPRDLPIKVRSRRNEPAHLRHVAEVVAQERGVSLEELADSTTRAARSLFKLPAINVA